MAVRCSDPNRTHPLNWQGNVRTPLCPVRSHRRGRVRVLDGHEHRLARARRAVSFVLRSEINMYCSAADKPTRMTPMLTSVLRTYMLAVV